MAVRTTAGKRIVRFLRPSLPPSGVSFRTNISVGLLFGRARLISVILATNRLFLTVKPCFMLRYQEYVLET
jgi:hypothetical protein